MDPFLILVLGLIVVIGAIIWLRIHPFLALLFGAVLVSFLSPITPGSAGSDGFGADWIIKLTRVSEEFGVMAGKISFLIVFGAIIGVCLTESGAASKIILVLCRFFGIKRVPVALLASGFFLSIPVFYDVTFYLLLPLAKAVYRATSKHYLLYLLVIGFGATLSHTLVPPTPGPLVVADMMGVSVGSMMLVGVMTGLLAVPCALGIATILDRLNPDPERRAEGDASFPENQDIPTIDPEEFLSGGETAETEKLPSFFMALLPLLLPVLLIAAGTSVETLGKSGMIRWTETWLPVKNVLLFISNAQFALFVAALVAVWGLVRVRHFSRRELEKRIGQAIYSTGTIILITSAGGAFGAMLRICGVGERVSELASHMTVLSGPFYLILAFAVAAVIKTSQGSSTTAMITTAGIFSTLNANASVLGFHPAYLAAAIGVGAMVTGWMNDSGFCIFAGMSGLTETATLKTWTVGLVFLGLSALVAILILSTIIPLV